MDIVSSAQDAAQEPALMKRVIWRVMPLLMLTYLIAVIDRANVGFAKLQMVKDLNMTEQAYGLAASLFFVGYLVFEIPSTLAVHRFGARRWLARILFSWGLITVLMAFTTSVTMFTVLRLLLGVFEAGAYPGVIFFTTLWFPQAYRVRVMGIVTLGSAFGNMFGALMAGALLDLDGAFGLRGWQWVFIATGLPAILMTFAVLFGLPDTPADARFLSADEKRIIAAQIAQDGMARAQPCSAWSVLWDGRVVLLGVVYTLILTSLYGVIYWLPTVVKGFGATGTQNGLLASTPWAITAVILTVLPGRLCQHNAVLMAIASSSLVGVLAFVASTLVPANWMRMVAMTVGTPCISLLLPCFWSLPSRFLSGERAAAGIGAISTVGSFGGLLAQNLMPVVAERTGTPVEAMLVPAVCLAVLGIGASVAERRTRPQSGPTAAGRRGTVPRP